MSNITLTYSLENPINISIVPSYFTFSTEYFTASKVDFNFEFSAFILDISGSKIYSIPSVCVDTVLQADSGQGLSLEKEGYIYINLYIYKLHFKNASGVFNKKPHGVGIFKTLFRSDINITN